MNDNPRVAANTCSSCCYLAMLDASDEVIDDLADIHEQIEVSRGALEIDRRCAERVRNHVPCDGPVMNQDGHLTCPLVDLFNASIAMAACRPRTGSFAVPPEKVLNSGPERAPGQFL
jgi:hypothetical protein